MFVLSYQYLCSSFVGEAAFAFYSIQWSLPFFDAFPLFCSGALGSSLCLVVLDTKAKTTHYNNLASKCIPGIHCHFDTYSNDGRDSKSFILIWSKVRLFQSFEIVVICKIMGHHPNLE